MTITLLTGIANHVKSDTCNHANKVVSFECYKRYCLSAMINYGLSAHTHAGTLGVFGMNFVKTGKIDKELGAFFSRMEQLRMKADYNCEYDVSNSDVENMLQPAHDFLNSIIKLIKEKQ